MRNRSLDGLRGIAVLSVVIHHYFHAKLLWAGVDLFFVLSGYLITSILLRTKDKSFGPYIGTFYKKRVRRILPPYAMLLVIVTLLLGAGWMAHGWLYFGLMNFAMPMHFDIPEQLGVLWSLAVEEQFYLLWPVAVYFLSGKHLERLTISLLFIAPFARFGCTRYFAHHWAMYMLLPFRMDTLAAGSLAALYWPRMKATCNGSRKFHLAWAGAAVLAVAMFGVLSRQGITTYNNTAIGNTAIYEATLLMVFSLFMVALSGGAKWLFELAPLVGMGTISYSVYLIHQTAKLQFNSVLVALAATLIYAVAMWFAVEKPLTRRAVNEMIPSPPVLTRP